MSITIIKKDGGLKRALPTDDHVSCLLFEHASNAPASWNGDTIRSFRSLAQLEQSGILASDLFYGIVHYHVSEYFRMHENGEVYVGFNLLGQGSVTATANSIKAATNGRVRQYGVFYNNLSATADSQALMDELEGLAMDGVVIFGYTGSLSYTSIPDQTTKPDSKVWPLIAGDGANKGASYATALGLTYIPAVGSALGALSLSKVHESFAYVRLYNMSDGQELEDPVMCDGTKLASMLAADLQALKESGFGFFVKQVGVAGTYISDNRTATDPQSDYSSLNINRVAQKAARGIRAELVQELNGSVKIDPVTGQLSVGYIDYIETLTSDPLQAMQVAGELSGYTVFIDPTQNLLQTSALEIEVTLIPIGISREIKVTLSFALSE